ncbi:class I SAM-dependent RNA methyltransferase [Pseudoroseicyclus tamaricis]|uniref:Class I SAM-dependent RNA methyltransferase n=1 Tax=Pseudoroseicyclus tamaricis TaxID=2705421 RepID=A0A6B2JW34_9RHOB|nr:class I SAM-dependent RNA methyltransferase [Pseudoroseicyclus tamaricis]NDV02707.1 class I SAM-dependent RNA methyltransferase [Pseudoroseicyclus tamaricis]
MALRIETLTLTGQGRAEDGSLHPRVLPGELVEPGEGTPRILEPSATRVSPPCRHFRTCGGCAMQHASDPFVADWKRGIVEKALAAQGIEAEVTGPETSPPRSRRRARFSGRRTKGGALVGFHMRASDQITAIPDCQLVTERLRATLPALEALTVLAASRKSEVALTVTDSLAGPEVLVEGGRPLDRDLRMELPALAAAHELSRIAWGDEVVAELSAPAQAMGRARVSPPPGAFLQATAEGEAALRAEVEAATQGARRIVDLFAGCGTFTLPLAERAEVHAVEGDAAMLRALDAGWRGPPGLHRVTTEARDLFRRPLLPDELARFDAAVIDPPRAGAEAQIAEIAASTLSTVALVSCNPVTFARDAARLTAAGFTLGPVRVVDQFRWSSHVELATRATR